MPLFQARTNWIWKHYTLGHPDWTLPDLKIVLLSDLHFCAPWTPLSLMDRLVREVEDETPDLVLLGGDYLAQPVLPAKSFGPEEVVQALSRLKAKIGVFAVLGNHDWWEDKLARDTGRKRNALIEAFADSPIDLLSNQNRQLTHMGETFRLVGFDSQFPDHKDRTIGNHDPDLAFAGVPEGEPTILLAHEPDCFAKDYFPCVVQLSGHTHGGQMKFFGVRPFAPKGLSRRYIYGHLIEDNRHLIVTGGLGFSAFPLRIAQPCEATTITLTQAPKPEEEHEIEPPS